MTKLLSTSLSGLRRCTRSDEFYCFTGLSDVHSFEYLPAQVLPYRIHDFEGCFMMRLDRKSKVSDTKLDKARSGLCVEF